MYHRYIYIYLYKYHCPNAGKLSCPTPGRQPGRGFNRWENQRAFYGPWLPWQKK